MASLNALSKNPTFTAKVGLPQAGEADMDVVFTFRYRTKKELDALDAKLGWRARRSQDRRKSAASVESERRMAERRVVGSSEPMSNADMVLEMCSGWGFEEPFNRENVEEMLDRSIGAAVAIHMVYKSELVKVRLGNFGQ